MILTDVSDSELVAEMIRRGFLETEMRVDVADLPEDLLREVTSLDVTPTTEAKLERYAHTALKVGRTSQLQAIAKETLQ